MSQHPRISVIVPVFNGERTVTRCVASLERQSLPREQYEIIVVDDGSTDATASLLRAIGGLKLIHQPNAGPAAARNRGIAEARGAILVFTDADCRVDHLFLEKLVAPLIARPDEVVAAQARYRTEQTTWVARLAQWEIEERYDAIRESDALTGIGTYGAAYWKHAVEAAGGFNQTYRVASGEDFALSYALTRGGKRAVLVPDAIVYHEHPDTLKRYYKSKKSRGYWRVLLRQQYPAESIRDSYVPRSLIAQVALVATLPPFGAAAALLAWTAGSTAALWFGVGYAGIFVATAARFVARVWRHEKSLWLASIVFVFVRALAINAGMVAGIRKFGFRPKRLMAEA